MHLPMTSLLNTHLLIARTARIQRLGPIFCLGLLLSACSSLPAPPLRPQLYDFGPGLTAAAPQDRRAPLSPLALAPVEAVGTADAGQALHYRLAYADAQQLRPYAQARWSQPPAQLLQQRLREQLAQRHAVLGLVEAASLARDAKAGGTAPDQLRVELEEFSQVFTSPQDSAGVIRLRATVLRPGPGGMQLRGQRAFTVRHPARQPDAAGGVLALTEASDQAIAALLQWLEQLGP